jgi:hypothetical protein
VSDNLGAQPAPRLLLPVVLTAGILVTTVFYFTDMPPDRARYYTATVNSWKRLAGIPVPAGMPK